jgi:DNA topoisomerase-1
VFESEDLDQVTPFEEAWDELATKPMDSNQSWHKDELGANVWTMLLKAHVLSRIGHFGILLLGLDDGKGLQDPVDGVTTLNRLDPVTNSFKSIPLQGDCKPLPQEVNQLRALVANKKHRWQETRWEAGAEGQPGKWVAVTNERPCVFLNSWVSNASPPFPPKKPKPPAPPEDQEVEAESAEGEDDDLAAIERAGAEPEPGEGGAPEGDADLREIERAGAEAEQGKPGDQRPAPFRMAAEEDEDALPEEEQLGSTRSKAQGSHDPQDLASSVMAGTDAQYFGVQFGPSEQWGKPAGKPTKLIFLRAFDESMVQVVRWEWNIKSPRFGLPVMYQVTLNDPRDQQSGIGLPLATVFVHWSRVIHITDSHEQPTSSDNFSPPAMQSVFNRLLDIQKVLGAAAEGYWKSCFTGLSFETHPQLGGEVEVDEAALRDVYENYINGLQRVMMTKGMSINQLAPSVVDPRSQFDTHVDAICINKGIPKRIFLGSERGELASSQDDEAWNDRLRNYQLTFITPKVIVPFVDRLIQVGVLPQPQDGFTVIWPDVESLGEQAKATVAATKTQALVQFISGGGENGMTLLDFYTRWMGMSEEEAQQVIDSATEAQLEKQQQQATMDMGAPGMGGPPGMPGTPPGVGGPPGMAPPGMAPPPDLSDMPLMDGDEGLPTAAPGSQPPAPGGQQAPGQLSQEGQAEEWSTGEDQDQEEGQDEGEEGEQIPEQGPGPDQVEDEEQEDEWSKLLQNEFGQFIRELDLILNDSYFGKCERDDKGRCVVGEGPQEGQGQGEGKDSGGGQGFLSKAKGAASAVASKAGQIKAAVDRFISKIPVVGAIKGRINSILKAVGEFTKQRYGETASRVIMASALYGPTSLGSAALGFKLPGIKGLNDVVGVAAATAVAEAGLQIGRAARAIGKGIGKLKKRITGNAALFEDADPKAMQVRYDDYAKQLVEWLKGKLEGIAQEHQEELEQALQQDDAISAEAQELLKGMPELLKEPTEEDQDAEAQEQPQVEGQEKVAEQPPMAGVGQAQVPPAPGRPGPGVPPPPHQPGGGRPFPIKPKGLPGAKPVANKIRQLLGLNAAPPPAAADEALGESDDRIRIIAEQVTQSVDWDALDQTFDEEARAEFAGVFKGLILRLALGMGPLAMAAVKQAARPGSLLREFVKGAAALGKGLRGSANREEAGRGLDMLEQVVERLNSDPAALQDLALGLEDLADGLKEVVAKRGKQADPTENIFCATGKGGGKDPTCTKETRAGETLVKVSRKDDQWVGPDGKPLPDHAQKLKIPPKYHGSDVYINPDPKGDLLASWKDEKGRTQPLYANNHSMRAAARKFGTTRELLQKKDQLLRETLNDAKNPALKDRAECLRLIMLTGMRSGNEGGTGADHESYGATTLEGRHVKATKEGVTIRLVPGKSRGKEKEFRVTEPAMVKALLDRKAKAGPDGRLFGIDNFELLAYSKLKGGFKIKDHRTAVGTEEAIKAVKDLPVPKTVKNYKAQVRKVSKRVSDKLGNTPSVALHSYIDPIVFAHWRKAVKL